jgi:outer membrane lipoprotein-sorting protein
VIQRTKYARPEDDGVTELIIYVDTETLLQVGTVLKGADGQLIAEYYFRDIRLNPQFRPNQFTRAALK